MLRTQRENGFEVSEIKKQGGKFVVLALLIQGLIPGLFTERGLVGIGQFFQIIFYPIIFPISFLLFFLDKLDKNKDLTLQYECIFTRRR